MSRILRIFAYFCLICFTSNVFAAGYTCPSNQKYTSCKSGYFMSAGLTGGSGTNIYSIPNNTVAAGNKCIECSKSQNYSSSVTTCPGGTFYPRYKVAVFYEGMTSTAYRSADNTKGLYKSDTATDITTDWATLWGEKVNYRNFYDFKGIYSAANGGGTQYVNADGTVTSNFASFASAKSTTAPTIYPYYTAKKTTCAAGEYLECVATSDCLCKACPAGKYCKGGEYTHQNTTTDIGITGNVYSGYYSTGGASTTTPTAAGNGCLSGYQCGKCAQNTYSGAGASSCTACPTGWYSDAGSTVATDCYKTFRLNKNGASFAADAWSSLGLDNMGMPYFADVISNVSGTANATVKVWYHADKGYTSYLGIPDARTEPSGYALTGGVGTTSTCTTGPTQTDWMDGASFMYDIRSLTNSLSSGSTLYLCRSASTFAVNYAAGNGSGTAPTSPTACTVGGTCTAPSNTYTAPTGYEFSGWKCTNGNTYCNGDIISVRTNMANFASAGGSITLTAQWTPKTYSITVSKNGGTGNLVVGKTSATGTNSAVVSCTHGDSFDVSMLPAWDGGSANNLTNSGKIFTGWSETSNFTCTANKTITAVWGTATCVKGRGVESTTYSSVSGNAPVCSVTCSAGYYYASATITGTAGVASFTVQCPGCDSGVYSSVGAKSCTPCPVGTYASDVRYATSCTPCPAGRTTSGTGTAYNATETTACSVTCSNSSNVSDWATPSWTAANGATYICQIGACSSGYVTSNNACSECTYTKGTNVSSVSVTGSSGNICNYSYTCTSGYNVSGSSSGTASGVRGVASNTVGSCSANSYTISFYSNGGAGTLPSKPMLYGEEYTLPGAVFSYTGYNMTGWKCTGGGSNCDGDVYGLTDVVSNLTTDNNDTVSMTAQWTPKSVTCSAGKYLPAGSVTCASCLPGYYCDGGSFTFNVLQDQGLTNVCPDNYYSTGGASTCQQCKNTAYGYGTTGDKPENHDEARDCQKTIWLNKNGGTDSYGTTTESLVLCHQDETCTFDSTSNWTQTGYTFTGGWGNSTSCTSTTRNFTNPLADRYYACKSPITRTVTFKTGNTTMGTQSIVYDTPNTLKLESTMSDKRPVSSSYGWSFAGWATATSTTGTPTIVYTDGDDISNLTSDLVLYAVYVRDAKFTYYTNVAINAITDKVSQYYRNTSTTAAAVTSVTYTNSLVSGSKGWSPIGWKLNSTTANSSGNISTSTTLFTPSKDANAQYSAIYKRTVSLQYDANGGTGSMSTNQTATQYLNATGGAGTVVQFTLADCGFSNAGLEFVAWRHADNEYNEGDNVAFSGYGNWSSSNVITVYAVWNNGQFEFSLNPNNATSTNDTRTLYTTYDTGVYLDSSRSKKMTTSTNPITKPKRSYTVTYNNKYGTTSTATSTYTFNGYTGAAVGSGIKTMINANGYITTDGENAAKVFAENKIGLSNAPWTAQWTGGSVTLPSVTLPVGYGFGGWYTAETGGTRVGGAGESYTPTTNVTLYARWVPKVTQVMLDYNNGSATMQEIYAKYETGWYSNSAATINIEKVTPPTKEGFIFRGYFTEKLGDVTDNQSANSSIYINQYGDLPEKPTVVGYNVKMYAAWAEECIAEGAGAQCSVTIGIDGSVSYTATCPEGMFLSGNGTSRPSCGAQRVELVSSYTHDDGREFDAQTQADPNVVYLIPNMGTVTQNTGFYSDVFGVNKITKLTKVPVLENTCFAFQGFYSAPNGTGIQRIDKDGNILTNNYMLPEGNNPSLYADYIATSFTLKYDAGTGTKDDSFLYPNQVCFLTGNNSTAPCTLATPADKGMSKAGYTFAGWRCTGGGTSNCNGNIYPAGTDMRGKIADCTTATFTAQWQPINTTITLVKNNTGSNKATYGTSTLYAQYDYGLFADANYEQPMLTNGVGFTAPVKQFTVTFDDNIGGSNSANVDYVFKGYFSASSGGTQYTGTQYALNAGINAAKKYTTNQQWHAQWTSANVPLPSVSRTGYTFDGWYTAATGGTKVGDAGTPYTPTASVTLYAHWTPCSYTVVFDKNGGSGAMTEQTFYVDAAQNLNANTFTRVGAKFMGWATTKGATTAEYTDGQSVTNLATTCNADDVTLYAVWKNMVINGPKDQTKVYDGKTSTCHGNLSVTSPADAVIKYAESQNGTYSTTAPTITNVADSKTIYYQISATDYTTVSGSFQCTVTPATMDDMGTGNSKVYDGTPLTCSGALDEDVPAGSTIEYSTDSNGSYSTTAPTKTNVLESNVVYYRVTNPNYVTKTGSFECVIEKAENPITLSAYSGHVSYGRTTTVSVTKAQGSLSVASSDTKVARATLSETTVNMTGGSSYGTATITVTAAGNYNYLAGSQKYTLYVDQGIIRLNPGAGTGGTPTILQQYDTGVWLDVWNGNYTMTTTANRITIPSRNGYVFAGYYADADSTTALIGANGFITQKGIDAAKAAESDIIWVAKWTPNTITINYDPNGGTSVASTTCKYDSTFVLAAAPANSGKQFSNWSVNGGTYNAGATINCNYATLGVYSGAATIKANWGTCPAGSYCPTDGAPQACPPNYPNSDVGATRDSDCYLTTTAGNYVATKNADEVPCKSGGYYCSGDVRIYYGLTGGDSACADLSGIEVPNGTYSTSPSTGASAPSACRYVAPSTTVTGCSTVTANTVSYTGSKWNSNYYTVTAAKGYHVGDNNVANPTCVMCGADYYQPSDGEDVTSCTPCLANYHTYGDTAADHDAASDCLISCDGGYYLANANDTTCSDVKAGYWAQSSMVAQGSTGSRTQCKNGWTTIGYGFGANEETDCGRIFNYGNQKIYLRSAKRGDASQPALHVKIGDVIFYGTMKQVTGPQSGFNAEYDGKNYLIVNDDQ